jgi:DnaJ-class molecular chaperone
MGGDPNQQQGFRGRGQGQGNPFEFHFGSGNFQDFNDIFGFGRRQQRRNTSFNVNIEITLEEVLTGKDINAEVGMPGRGKKIVNISIPPGIEHGQQIRYQGMGDNSMPDVPAGDLLVNVIVRPHSRFRREGSNIIYDTTISAWDAILGTNLEIISLDEKTLNITIPPGSQPETVLSCRGEGLPHMQSRLRGNLLIKIKVSIPKNLTVDQLDKIKSIKNSN